MVKSEARTKIKTETKTLLFFIFELFCKSGNDGSIEIAKEPGVIRRNLLILKDKISLIV